MARHPSERTRFEVLLEAVRADQRTLAEGHSLLDAKMDRIGQQLGQRIDGVEQQIRQVAVELKAVGAALLDVSSEMRAMRTRFGETEQRLEGIDHRLIAHEQLHHN